MDEMNKPTVSLMHCMLFEQVVHVSHGGRCFVTWDGNEQLALRILRPDGRISTLHSWLCPGLESAEDAAAAAADQ